MKIYTLEPLEKMLELLSLWGPENSNSLPSVSAEE